MDGGRTVEYAIRLKPYFVKGIEIFPNMVEYANAYAKSRGVKNVEFLLTQINNIDLENESIDNLITYDVIEHVEDPFSTMQEIYRILKPGGYCYIKFPPYDCMNAHHLDNITRLPFLHWLFSPFNIHKAFNRILENPPKYFQRTCPKRSIPLKSHNGKRYVLENLNGLTSYEFFVF